MKKEEFFDALEDVEQKYISEAFFDDLDGDSTAVARPGKAKISPIKILAPIAACLAVVIGTGFVASRVNKPETSDNSNQQSAQEQIDPKAFVQVNFEDKDLKEIYNSNVIELDFEPEELERDFIAECISMIKNENEAALQDGITWKVTKPEDFYCGWSGWHKDYYILPQIDGHAVADIGARVFHRTKGYSSIYGETFDVVDHGGFGKGYEDLDLDYVFSDSGYIYMYYYRTETIGLTTSESIRTLTLFGNDEIVEKPLLEKVTDGDTITYIQYNTYDNECKKLGEEEFIGIWNTYPFVPKFYTEFTNEEVEECREALREELGIPDSLKVRWRDAEVDIDLDGTKELLLSPNDTEDFKGVYVYARTSSGIKEVGSFDTEKGLCNPEEIRYRNVSADDYFPYYVAVDTLASKDGLSWHAMWSVNKILVDENGNIATYAFILENVMFTDEETHECKHTYYVDGEEVSHEEYSKEFNKYDFYDSHEYRKPTVPTNPDNYAWD